MQKPIIINCKKDKKIFWLSDQHFTYSRDIKSLNKEKIFIKFLNLIKDKSEVIFILGDFFNFWYEYKNVIPKGFIRILGKLAELSDLGVKFFYFTGNHDQWVGDYFEKELNFLILKKETEFIIDDKIFLIGHGDGLGPLNFKYKCMKKIFSNSIIQFLFRWIHPDLGIPIANFFSKRNKLISGKKNNFFLGEDKESLIQYSKLKLKEKHYDYFIFGHRHLPLKIPIKNSIYFNLGDWINYYTYLEYYKKKFFLKKIKFNY